MDHELCLLYCMCILSQDHGTIMHFPGAEVTDRNLLMTDCDILVPAAGEKQITADIANDIKAKVVLMSVRYTPKCAYRTVPIWTS